MDYKWKERNGIWYLNHECLHVVVHRYLDADPEKWFCSCKELYIDKKELHNEYIENAKREALYFLENHTKMLNNIIKDLIR